MKNPIVTNAVLIATLCFLLPTPTSAAFRIDNGNTITATPGGPQLTGVQYTNPASRAFRVWACATSASTNVSISCIAFWDYHRLGSSTASIPWNTFITRGQNNLPRSIPNPDIAAVWNSGATRICLYEDANGNGLWTYLGECQPISILYTPTACTFYLPPTLDFGVIAAGAAPVRRTINGSVSCDNASTVAITSTDRSLTTNRVLLDASGSLYADIDVGGSPGTTPTVFTVQRNVSQPFTVGATVRSSATTSPGVYNGTALVRVTWP